MVGGWRPQGDADHAHPNDRAHDLPGDPGGRGVVLIAFPAGPETPCGHADGEGVEAARARLPEAVRLSHDRLCTVSNTVRRGTPVEMTVA